MFLLPLLVLAGAGYGIYAFVRRRRRSTAAPGVAVGATQPRFWPTSTAGRAGVGALAAAVVARGFVGLVQVPLLGWALVAAAVVLTALGRVQQHDHSQSVLIALVVSSSGLTAAVLFLAGEVLVGHD